MRSEKRYLKEVYSFSYRGILYEVSKEITSETFRKDYYCAYFYFNHTQVDLGCNIQDEVSVDMNRLPESIFSAAGFLGSALINEIETCAHFSFTYAQYQEIMSYSDRLDTRDIVKLGVDYCHIGDKEAGHTLDSVCEDCEKVIDKVHSLGIYKGETK